jgi:hypothetical protein
LFEALGDKLGNVFDGLTGRGALSESDVNKAMREIRIALLEADVALPVVKQFVEKVRVQAVGEKVIKSIKPGQMVVKIVNDALIDMLGGTLSDDDADKAEAAKASELNLAAKPPAAILMGFTCAPRLRRKFCSRHWIPIAPPRWISWACSRNKPERASCRLSKAKPHWRLRSAQWPKAQRAVMILSSSTPLAGPQLMMSLWTKSKPLRAKQTRLRHCSSQTP